MEKIEIDPFEAAKQAVSVAKLRLKEAQREYDEVKLPDGAIGVYGPMDETPWTVPGARLAVARERYNEACLALGKLLGDQL